MKLAAIRLKEFRKRMAFSVEGLAKKVDCSTPYMYNILNGTRERLSIELAQRIEDFTEIKVKDWTIEEKDNV